MNLQCPQWDELLVLDGTSEGAGQSQIPYLTAAEEVAISIPLCCGLDSGSSKCRLLLISKKVLTDMVVQKICQSIWSSRCRCFTAGLIDVGQQESKVSQHCGDIEVSPFRDCPFPMQIGIFCDNFPDLRGKK